MYSLPPKISQNISRDFLDVCFGMSQGCEARVMFIFTGEEIRIV